MNKTLKQTLFWAPRIAGIPFILFLSLFALDIFGQGYSFWETIVGLFMHLIPSIILAIAVALAWLGMDRRGNLLRCHRARISVERLRTDCGNSVCGQCFVFDSMVL